jgi:putative ABC transport system substrate-binding protein
MIAFEPDGTGMRRREFVGGLGGVAALWPLTAHTQPPAMPIIGFLDPRTPEATTDRLVGFRQGLKEGGFVEGDNVSILYSYADNRLDRLPGLVADLVGRKVMVIVTSGAPAGFAVKATNTIPGVVVIGDDPVRLGLVASLARPGNNITGVNILIVELAAKRLELLRSLVPKSSRIAVLINPADPVTENQLNEVQRAATTMGLQIEVLRANTSREINTAFDTMERGQRPDALFITASPFLNGRHVQLAQLAAYYRLPAAFPLREAAEVGGLMSYGIDIVDAFRQAGSYASRILKGSKPADLPVIQSPKFELVVNSATARMLGLTVPASLNDLADALIE